VVENWIKISLLLNFLRIIKGGGFDKLTIILVDFVTIFGGLKNGDLTLKFVCFGVDGVTIFQGLNNSLTIQMT
jgi:hypothetical protein